MSSDIDDLSPQSAEYMVIAPAGEMLEEYKV